MRNLVRSHTGIIRSLLAYGLGPLLGLATAPILARSLGPEGRGALAASLQPLTVADAVAAFGLPVAVTYFAGRGVGWPAMRGSAFVIASVTTVPVLAILFCYATSIAPRIGVSTILLCLLWFSPLAAVYLGFRRSLMQGRGQLKVLDLERALSAVLRLAFIALLAVCAVKSGYVFAVGSVLSGMVASIALFWPSKSPSLSVAASGVRVGPKEMAGFAFPVGLGTIAVAANNRLDQAVLPSLANLQTLGLYAVAVTVAEVPTLISVVMSRNLLSESSRGADRSVLVRTFLLGFSVITTLCLALAISGPTLMRLGFGLEFESAVPATRILLLGTWMSYVTVCCISFLAGRGRPGRSSIPPACGFAITAILYASHTSGVTLNQAAWFSTIAAGFSALCAIFVLRTHALSLVRWAR